MRSIVGNDLKNTGIEENDTPHDITDHLHQGHHVLHGDVIDLVHGNPHLGSNFGIWN